MTQDNTQQQVKVKGGAAPTQSVQKAHAGRVLAPFDEMDRLFDRMLPRNWLRPMHWEWPPWAEHMTSFEGKLPRVDVIDKEAQVVIRAELPGVKKEDLDVSLSGDSVTIRGTSRQDETEKQGEYYRREMSYGEISRTIALPAEVDKDQAKAVFKDGVLELTLPKAETAKRSSVRIETE